MINRYFSPVIMGKRIMKGELLGPPQASYISEPRGKDFDPKKFMSFYKKHLWPNVAYNAIREAERRVVESDPARKSCLENLGVIAGNALLELENVSDYNARGWEDSSVHVIRVLQVIREMPYGRFSIMGSTPQIVSDGQLVVCNTHPSEASPFLGVVDVGILSSAVEDLKNYQNGSAAGTDENNFDSGKAFDELFKTRVIGDAKNMGATGVLIGEIKSETDVGGPKPTMGDHPVNLYLPVTYLK